MQNKLVSIIMPVYNAQDVVTISVESILNQTYKDFELIIINDGSKDNSLEVCRQFMEKDKRVKVINQENSGAAGARNTGLDNISGEYVTFIDADDYVLPNHIENLVKTMDFADLGIVNFKRIKPQKDYTKYQNKYLYKRAKGKQLNKDEFFKGLFAYPLYGGGLLWNKIYRKDLIKGIKFNPEYKYHEDINFVLQYAIKCEKFYYSDLVTYLYIVNASSMTSQKHFSEKRFSGLKVMKDNNEIAKNISPKVLSYSRAWQFLVNIEILFAFKHFKIDNKEVHDDVLKTLKETYPDFKKNKKNFNLFRRLAGPAYQLMKLFKF